MNIVYSHVFYDIHHLTFLPGAAVLPVWPHGQTDYSIDKSITVRNYQRELAEPGVRGDSYMVVAPTGTGKTLVAAIVISEYLKFKRHKCHRGAVIFMTHTRVLAEQQADSIKRAIPGSRVEYSTGRDEMLLYLVMQKYEPDIVVCTAGKLLNELQCSSEHMSIENISLLIIDECHHVVGSSDQAQVMEKYLEAKSNGKVVPQVVGLTASPGAGGNPRLELSKTLDHLIALCARMDAYGGIKRVEEHTSELERFTNKPDTNLQIIRSRDQGEPLIHLMVNEMMQLEPVVSLKSGSPRWSQEYESVVQHMKKELQKSLNSEHRDAISTLKILRCYCRSLGIYMDLRQEDALLVLREHPLPSLEQRTPHENMLADNLGRLIACIEKMPLIHNPLLEKSEDILRQNFTENPSAQAIFFIRTKKHAHGACEWLSTLPLIRPIVITGHNKSTGYGMTDADKDYALKEFRRGKCNVLVATSVAEEGIDIPECNLVIRFQHVTNEIAKVQADGRARAAKASTHTIVQSGSSRYFQEMKNEELDFLVSEALSFFPDLNLLTINIDRIQPEILAERQFKVECEARKAESRIRGYCNSVRLFCIGCKALACEGSDIYTAERSNHYVVPGKQFRERYITKPHPRRRTISGIIPFDTTHKLHCAKCDQDWGILCIWKATKGYELPVIKSVSFVFEINGHSQLIKKWSTAPFKVLPLSTQPEYQEFAKAD